MYKESFLLFFLTTLFISTNAFAQESVVTEHTTIVNKLDLLFDQFSNTNFFEIFGLFIAALSGITIPIWLDRRKTKTANRELLKKTSRSLLREIEHNRLTLSGEKKFTFITRNIDGNNPNIKYEINGERKHQRTEYLFDFEIITKLVQKYNIELSIDSIILSGQHGRSGGIVN